MTRPVPGPSAPRRARPSNTLLPRIPAPLPHPSWRLSAAGAAGEAPGTTPALTADDFWQRLGL